MKRKYGLRRAASLALTMVFLLTASTITISAQTQPTGIPVYIDGNLLQLEVAPIIQEGRTLVPLRAIFEALEADVNWNPEDKSISATKGNLSLWLKIGNTQAQKNGQPVRLDVPARIVNGRTLVPLRFVGESLGATVNWDNVKRVVEIVSDTSTEPAANDGSQTSSPGSGTTSTSQASVQPKSPPLVSFKSENFVTLKDGTRAITLKNGDIYPLLDLKETNRLREVVPAEYLSLQDTPEVLDLYEKYKRTPPKADVDLRQWQTPIKRQAGRNTCVSFAIVAAMEARYKRLNPSLYANIDLSEQYLHHVQKMAVLEETPASLGYRENAHAAWGYSNAFYTASLLLSKYGLPTEAQLPYIPGRSYEDTNEATDHPRIDPENRYVDQKIIDDFNLHPDRLPVAAIKEAGYRITAYMGSIDRNTLKDVNYYKAILNAGYEVVFSIVLCPDDPNPDNRIWEPGTKDPEGAHAMLMVGYDDSRRVFIVKNSWGPDIPEENGYTLVSYDYITAGYVFEALYITGVSNPPNPQDTKEQFFLGRWNVQYDGRQGILDIYKLPGIHSPSSLKGQVDRRIGNLFYYGPYGEVLYRVNGTVNGNKIEFYIDYQADTPYGKLGHIRFTGYLNDDCDFMAGCMEDTYRNKQYGFYATRGSLLETTPAPGDLGYSSFAGFWKINFGDGSGRLQIKSVNPITGNIEGTYTDSNGSSIPVVGKVQEDLRTITFSISPAAGGTRSFTGYLHTEETGTISGYTTINNRKSGFVASRFSPVVDSPAVNTPTVISPSGNTKPPANISIPAAPSNLKAVAGEQSIQLTWEDNSTDESGFIIERKGGDSSQYTQIATVDQNTTTYTDTGVTPLFEYTYRVKATNGLSSSYSNEVSATIALKKFPAFSLR